MRSTDWSTEWERELTEREWEVTERVSSGCCCERELELGDPDLELCFVLGLEWPSGGRIRGVRGSAPSEARRILGGERAKQIEWVSSVVVVDVAVMSAAISRDPSRVCSSSQGSLASLTHLGRLIGGFV